MLDYINTKPIIFAFTSKDFSTNFKIIFYKKISMIFGLEKYVNVYQTNEVTISNGGNNNIKNQ